MGLALAPGSSEITLDEVKAAVNEETEDNDEELQRLIDAAQAEYEMYVGPLPGSVTEVVDGGSTAIVLTSPNASAITAAAYDDGTEITTSDLTVRNGIVRWGYGTAGRFTTGVQNVTITYTVGSLPLNHREAIISDVAGLFTLTQRGGGSARGAFPSEGYDLPAATNPVVLFPRIRALAGPSIA